MDPRLMDTRDSLYRPSINPRAEVALGARSVGHYIVSPGWRDTVLKKKFLQVFWGVKGTGAFIANGCVQNLGPAQAFVYLPGMLHEVYSLDESWEYRWFTVDGPLAVTVASAFGLRPVVFNAGNAPIRLFEGLREAMEDLSVAGEYRAGALAYELLSLFAQRYATAEHTENSLVDTARRIINENWADPDLSINSVARKVGMHRTALAREFKKAVGLSPKSYLNSLRLQGALTMLKEGRLPINEVAFRCGFENPSYFARLVRSELGSSPSRIRENSVV